MVATHSTQSHMSLMGRFLTLIDLLAEAGRRERIRQVYGSMSLAQLHDIGLTPRDLGIALALPLGRDAGAELARVAAAEAARW